MSIVSRNNYLEFTQHLQKDTGNRMTAGRPETPEKEKLNGKLPLTVTKAEELEARRLADELGIKVSKLNRRLWRIGYNRFKRIRAGRTNGDD